MMTFNEIYKKYNRVVFHTIKKIVKNDLDAEELASETMIRVHKSLATYKEELAKLTTWIHHIAINTAIDFVRKKKLNTVSIDEPQNFGDNEDFSENYYMMGLKSTELNPEEILISDEVRSTMYKRYKRLNETDKLIAALHYFDGLSYENISKHMNIPLGTVKAKIHKARVTLMEAFPSEIRKLATIEK